jgi:hypothetical protein
MALHIMLVYHTRSVIRRKAQRQETDAEEDEEEDETDINSQ